MELITNAEIDTIAETAATKVMTIVEERLSARVAHMQQAAGEADKDLKAKQATAAELEGRLPGLRTRATQAQDDMRAYEDVRDALRLEVDELEPKARALRAEITDHKTRVAAV
ncbi:MAG TPA: hypothetical protein VE932_04980 [Patescibacteria group bacterium]|nr:hypothetical protein [Patescibacteria group bacterium]